MNADDKIKTDAFDISVCRRMLKTLRTTRRTNKSIIKELVDPVSMNVLCEKLIMRYFGHTARRNEKNLKKDILFAILGKVPGSR